MRKGLFIYPWDIIDNGLDRVAKELQQIQVNSVSLAVAYHQAKVLLPHNPKRRIYVHKGGCCYFPFKSSDYGCLKPKTGELLENYSGDFLRDAVIGFHKENIEVDAWAVVFHNSRLAGSHPECAIHNAYGEPSPSSLCPSNDETFRYGLKILADIAAAGVDAINTESVDFAGLLHGDHHEMYAYENVAMMEKLLGICFCDSCIKRAIDAGVDAKELQRKVISKTERFLKLEPIDFSEIQGQLENYQALQLGRITEFYTELRNRIALSKLTTRIVPILWLVGGSNPRQYGMDMERIGELTDGFIAAYPDSPAKVAEFTAVSRKMVPNNKEIIGGIRLMAPHTVKSSQVKEYMNAYRKNGIDKVLFYNYGLAPQPFLNEIREDACNG